MFLLEEFWCNDGFGSWFYERLRQHLPNGLPSLIGAHVVAGRGVSGTGSDGRDGETDVLVIFRNADDEKGKGVVVLIEDKITAPFTEDQPARYRTRLATEQKTNECDVGAIVLVAPRRRLETTPADVFDLILPLEDMLGFLVKQAEGAQGELQRRLKHRSFMLERVCHDLHRYGVANVIPNSGNTDAIQFMEAFVERKAPQIRVIRRSVRGNRSYGPGFDLPGKQRLRDTASNLGVRRTEINFNWFVAQGVIRIRFHNWQSLVPILERWFLDNPLPEFRISVPSGGTCLDIQFDGLAPLDTATDFSSLPSDETEAVLGPWVRATIKMCNAFQMSALQLDHWLRTTGTSSKVQV